MTRGARELQIIDEDLSSHPAVRAWKRLNGAASEPERIEVLKRPGKSAIYRLVGVGPARASVIAKQASMHRRSPEVFVHLNVHPRLDVRTVECYGFMAPSGDERPTLFLEDAGTVQYSPRSSGQRELAATWLAALHGAFAGARIDPHDLKALPDRGPAHYLDLLQLATDALSSWRAAPAGHREAELPGLLLAQCSEIESRWSAIEELCNQVPPTLVHGDLCRQNMFLVSGPGGRQTLLPVDWEEAGLGPPAVDLARLPPGHAHFAAGADIATYAAEARTFWPLMDLSVARGLSTAGTIFRGIAATFWATESVSEKWWRDGEVDDLRVYFSIIESTLAELDSGS